MKKNRLWQLLIPIALLAAVSASAQEKLKVETFHLDNGLKVILAEEHSSPQIYGEVIVHAGSKNEDTSATGVAHYFEHIMFKGTDRIGTNDWAKEKVYLDSISLMYDKLRETKDEEGRKRVQKEINRLNIEASKFAIANETGAILQQMGCTGLNAGTSYDQTIYYNTLPSNQLENWMIVYAERFRNPVYRLFQGELEAVYEERNLYANNIMFDFIRQIFKESFGEHPYSRDIIGLDDHLKNPQPSQMKVFYDKYYVASNMTLLLVGDFDSQKAKQLARKHFSQWPKGEKQSQPAYELPKFEQQTIKEVKMTPIKAGLMVFPGVPCNHPDELALKTISSLLSGGNGSMDVLATEGKLMSAQLIPFSLNDAGSNVIFYVPKLIGQKHEEAETLIWACIDSIRQGRFSEKLMESIVMTQLRNRVAQLENMNGIAELLETLECQGSNYEEWERENERLQQLGKEEIMRVAQKYFDRDHCTLLRSSMGFPPKSSAVKPEWDHLDVQNQGAKSEFARMIENRPVEPIEPQIIDFKKDVEITPLSPHCNLYAVANPKNNLFELSLNYHYGLLDDKRLDYAAQYLEMLGCDSMSLQAFNMELERLGGSFDIYVTDDYTELKISGFEENLTAIMEWIVRKLRHPHHDQQQLDNLVEAMEASKKEAKKESDIWQQALRDYVWHGENSEYLDHLTLKELKAVSGEELIAALQPMFDRDGFVTFTGNTSPISIQQLLLAKGLIHQQSEKVEPRIRPYANHTENSIFVASNKAFVKSDIWFLHPCEKHLELSDLPTALLFNEYFGGGMNSIVFQEIREFRSLGYSTYGRFSYDLRSLHKPYLYCYLGTQCDKTNEGVEAMLDLTRVFPEREDKFAPAKDYLISTRNSNYVNFRQIPYTVRYWREVNLYENDPRKAVTEAIGQLKYEDLRSFHTRYLKDRPAVIAISGNTKKYSLKELEKTGTVKKLKYKDFIKF